MRIGLKYIMMGFLIASIFLMTMPALAGNCGLCLSNEYKFLRATYHGEEKNVRKYLARGINIEATSKCTYKEGYHFRGKTALLLASQEGHEEIVKLLLNAGANVNSESQYYSPYPRFKYDCVGKTALHYAALNGHVGCVGLLLEHRADMNKQDLSGSTPLHDAARLGQRTVVIELLKEGAIPNIKNHRFLTPKNIAYTRAVEVGDWEVFELLKKAEDAVVEGSV